MPSPLAPERMAEVPDGHYTTFAEDRRVGGGSLLDAARAAREALDACPDARVIAFDDATGRALELDLRGSLADVVRRYGPRVGASVGATADEDDRDASGLDPASSDADTASGVAAGPSSVADTLTGGDAATALRDAPPPGGRRRPGRPKLGVVGREVTLLPRHWAWLGAQRGGASATLRRLVDRARKDSADEERVRRSQDAAYRFMSAMVGDEAGFEEAARALFAADGERFRAQAQPWPPDLREYACGLAGPAFNAPSGAGE